MASPVSCSPCCSTATTTQIVGPAGADAAPIPPAAGSPEGVITGVPGQTYLNTTDDTFWVKKTGSATNTGWLQLLGLMLFLSMGFSVFAADQPSYQRGPLTTNLPSAQITLVTNIAKGAIAWDTTKQPADAALTNFINQPKFTGIVTNADVLGKTNFMMFSAGILTNVVIGAHP